jgi:hypothetical protein
MTEIDRPYEVPCPRCAGRTTPHFLQDRTEIKERLLDGTMTLSCAWCEQSRAPTSAEQDHLLQWSQGDHEWPLLIPDSVAAGDVVVCSEQDWFTYGRVTEDFGRVYLGSTTELLVACYLAAQHTGGRARVWFADAAGALTEYVYEVS